MMPRIDDVLSVFTPGVTLTSRETGSKIGVSAACAFHYLRILRDKGILEMRKEKIPHADCPGSTILFLWSLADADVPAARETNVAPRAYRNLRLTENLTGYESSLSRFANLCMMVRR